jgi:hypothetical protein
MVVLVAYLPPRIMVLPQPRVKDLPPAGVPEPRAAAPQNEQARPVALGELEGSQLGSEHMVMLTNEQPAILVHPETGKLRKVIAAHWDAPLILPCGMRTTARELVERPGGVEFIAKRSDLNDAMPNNQTDDDARFQIHGRVISMRELVEYCLEGAARLGVPPYTMEEALELILDDFEAIMSTRQRRNWAVMRGVVLGAVRTRCTRAAVAPARAT